MPFRTFTSKPPNTIGKLKSSQFLPLKNTVLQNTIQKTTSVL